MEWIVQLGFEQEIYLPDERAGMYWWLSSISASRVDLLERILDFVSQRHARFLRTGQKEDAAEVLETQTHVESMLHATKGCSSLAEALCSVSHYCSPRKANSNFISCTSFSTTLKLFQRLHVPLGNHLCGTSYE